MKKHIFKQTLLGHGSNELVTPFIVTLSTLLTGKAQQGK